MAARFLIKDRENKPYALVEILADGAQFHPVVAAAKSWSKWMSDEYAGKKISKEELTVTLDNSMSLETSVSDSMVEELKNRSLSKPTEDIEKKDASAELVPVLSLMDIQLSEFPVEAWKNAVRYKAVAFIADQNKSSFTYEVKRTRAVWDPSLAVPGTERRGGFRCPVGTRYGGQITDRFGRNCGWGVARRLANEISDIGERLENVGDARRERRVARRNERMARRLAGGGAIERGARAVGDALDLTGMGGRQGGRRNRVGQADSPKPGRLERAAGRIADVIDPDNPNRGGQQRPQGAAPRAPRQRVGGLRASERRRMNREIVQPNAARTDGGILPGGGRGIVDPVPTANPARRPRPNAPVAPVRPAGKFDWDSLTDEQREKIQAVAAKANTDAEEKFLKHIGVSGFNGNVVNLIGDDNWLERQPQEIQSAILKWKNLNTAWVDRPNSAINEIDWTPEERRKIQAIIDGSPSRPRPNAPQRPANPRPARPRNLPVDNTSGVPVPAGAPSAQESLDAYKTRKYNEHQAEVRRIRDRGGRAGFLRRDEWERFHGPAVEKAWRDRNPDAPPPAPARPAARPRPNAARNRRNGAAAQNGRRPANRRPRPNDQPDAVQPSAPRKPAAQQFTPSEEAGLRNELNQLRQERDAEPSYPRAARNRRIAQLERILGEQAAPAPAPAAAPAPAPAPARPPRAPRRPARAAQANGANTLRPAGVRDRIGEGQLNENRGVGRLPEPKIIQNSNIQNKRQAVEHVKNGGDLNEVPHVFWRDAIAGNLRTAQNPTGRFAELAKNGGAIGDTQIFVMVDENGAKTNRGWVFKAGRDTRENMGELVAWNMAAAHGFDIEGAHLDGKNMGGRQFVVLPFASQNIPEDWQEVAAKPRDKNRHFGAANYQVGNMDELPDRAYPQRTRQFLFNYLLGVDDRHGQNGWGKVYTKPDGTKVAHVMPIDLGWAGRAVRDDPNRYLMEYRMEQNDFSGMNRVDWPADMQRHLNGLAPAERTRQRDAIIKAVDDMISEGNQVAQIPDTEVGQYVERMFPADMPNTDRTAAIAHAVRLHRVYVQQHQNLVRQRTRILNTLVG